MGQSSSTLLAPGPKEGEEEVSLSLFCSGLIGVISRPVMVLLSKEQCQSFSTYALLQSLPSRISGGNNGICKEEDLEEEGGAVDDAVICREGMCFSS